MHLYLVRHAKAGRRRDWDGPDHLRPLSKKGRRQAEGLVSLLLDRDIRRVLSSPYVRCVQTVGPLADKLGLVVETVDALAENARTDDVLAVMGSFDDANAVLCTHGDVIPDVLDALAHRDGLRLPADYPYPKGSTWELVGQDGRYVEANYIAPPA